MSTDIKNWSTTASQNNSPAPDGFPEGMAPSDVNNSARQVMAEVREWYDGVEWREWGHTISYGSATTFTTSAGDGDTTAIYHQYRRVRAVGTVTGTIYGTINSSAYTTVTTVTVVWDSGSLNNEALAIAISVVANQDHVSWYALADIPGNIGGVEQGNLIAPAGTKMVFYQAAAPVGWTIDSGPNSRMLYFSTSGGTTGGAESAISFTPSGVNTGESSHTHSTPNHTHGVQGTSGSTAITIAQMPSHTHSVPEGGIRSSSTGYRTSAANDSRASQTTGPTGSGQGHTHSDGTYSASLGGGSTSGSGSSHTHTWSSTNTFNPFYAVVICASKDA